MYWNMTDTGDIKIDLKDGFQHLDGTQAEQLVRFRRYANGDVDRVGVQQLFLKALADKILSSDTLIKSMPTIVKSIYDYVETDVSVSDAIKYINYIGDVDASNITMETLPGVGKYIGNVSYFVYDENELPNAVNRVFFSDDVKAEDTSNDLKTKSIQIGNSTGVSGLAGKYQEVLEADGYNITDIFTYQTQVLDTTKIVVKEGLKADELKDYFSEPLVVEDSSLLPEGADVLIILGTKDNI